MSISLLFTSLYQLECYLLQNVKITYYELETVKEDPAEVHFMALLFLHLLRGEL